MKNFKKWISIALSALFALAMVACGKKVDETETETSIKPLTKIENEYRVELVNFEQWNPDFSQIRVLTNFGKVSRNRDINYVKSGKYSAKLQPVGGIHKYLKPAMYYPFVSEYYDFNYQDFTYVDRVEFWLYNDDDRQQPVNVGLVSKIIDVDTVQKFPAETFYLQPKSWNLVTYYVDFSTMNITQNVSQNAMLSVQGVYMEFESSGDADVNKAPVYYLDDINLYYKEQPNTLKDTAQILKFTHKEGSDVYELCDFEQVYQKYVLSTYVPNPKCVPTLSIVKAEEENIDGFLASSGMHVLKVEMKGGDKYKGSHTEIGLSGKVVRAFYDQFVYDYDTQTPIIPVEELKNYYLAYDVYCASDVEAGYYFANFLYDSQDKTHARTWNAPSITIRKGEWVTWSWSLYDIANKTSSRNDDKNTSIQKAYKDYEKSYDAFTEKFGAAGYGDRITNAGQIRIIYPEFTGENRVMYIDNIRMYKA